MLEMRWGSSGLLSDWRFRIAVGVVVILAIVLGVSALSDDGEDEDPIARMARKKDVGGLQGAIQQGGGDTASRAVAALGTMGPDPRAVELLLTAIQDPRPVVREQAALALATATRREHVTEIRKMLREDDSPQVRASAAAALGRVYATEAVPDLIQAIGDKEDVVYSQSAWALGRIFGMIPGYAEKDSPARRKRMATYYTGFWNRYGKPLAEYHELREPKEPKP